jgi:hypothetical protein
MKFLLISVDQQTNPSLYTRVYGCLYLRVGVCQLVTADMTSGYASIQQDGELQSALT